MTFKIHFISFTYFLVFFLGQGSKVPCYSGIINAGNTCFMASAIQSLYANKHFRTTILNLSEDLHELSINEVGYWADPQAISALRNIFRKLNKADCKAISVDEEIIPIMRSMGFVLGQPNDSLAAFDGLLDKLPSTLKRSWEMPEITSYHGEDAIINIQRSCSVPLKDCFKHELENFKGDCLVLRVSREHWSDAGLIATFNPIQFPLLINGNLSLESIVINQSGSHYTSIVNHDESLFYCDDSKCRVISNLANFTDALTHSVQFVYSKQ